MACEDQKQLTQDAYAELEASITARETRRSEKKAADDAAVAAEDDTAKKAEAYKQANDAYVACILAN